MFRTPNLAQKLEKKKLHILRPPSLSWHKSGKTFLHYLTEDEAGNLMRPHPKRKLTNKAYT
jgi:hypothetical protein